MSTDWRFKNPERWKEHQRRYRETKRAACKRCDSKMPYGTSGLLYCSDECRITTKEEKAKARRLALRERVYDHKIGIGCSKCGYNNCGAALDWHHTDSNKERRLTVKSYFTPLGEREREKCILVCANCHREIHNE